ncbi:MAG TPA: substrate-binding domain-containing protein [Bacteroidales bacterium]|nr:substrate-binding domain-containing protein [Bacteroidales bacterium]
MKTNFHIFLSLVFIITACGDLNDKTKVGFMVHTLNDERWSIERDVFTSVIEQDGGEVLFSNAEQNERAQFHQAKKMIDAGVDAIVIVPVNSKTAASISRLCAKNDVKIIAYDIIIDNCDLDLYVSFDNVEIGRMMARYALTRKTSGDYVLLWGDSNMKVAHWIREGQMDVLDESVKSGNINIVYKCFVDGWSQREACHKVQKIVDYSEKDIDAYIASSDGIAAGVIESLEMSGIYDMPLITGQDASTTALAYIRQGRQNMSVYKSFKDLAKIAASETLKLINDQQVDYDTLLFNGRVNVKSVLLKTSIIDQDNLETLALN